MLENTRRQASVFIYLIFGLLIVIFILGINPGNRSGREGCSLSSNTVVTVDGAEANQTAFHVAYSANGASGRQKVYLALDNIIRRELLAQAAADRGIRATKDMSLEAIEQGEFFLGGQRIDFKPQFFVSNDDKTSSHFSYKMFKGWVNTLSVSENSYLDEQARGLQASLMSDLLAGTVRVSREEALSNYLYDNNTVTYDAVAFEPARYRREMKLTDADIKRFVEGHTADVQARYKADERTYKGVKPQLALREIFIPKAIPEAAKPEDKKPDDKDTTTADKKPDDKTAKADDKARPADKKPDDKTAKADDKARPADKKPDDKTAKADDKARPADKKPDDKARPADKAKPADKTAKADDKKPAAGDARKPFGLPIEEAKAKLEAVRAAVAAGKQTFVDAEKQLAASSSEVQPAENGDRGWRSVETPELGQKALNDAVKTLKPGEMTPVITDERGAYLVIATDKREGDLSFDQVKNEIGKEMAKDVWSKEAAKRDALEALARARSGTGKNLDDLFEKEPAKPGFDIQDIMNNPNLTPEQKQQLFQQWMQSQQGQKSGALELHEKDVPVAWYADDDGSAQAAPAGGAPAVGGSAGSPASAAPAAGSAAPAAGSAAPAAGSAAPAKPAEAPAAPAPVEITASSDVLPQFGEIAKPKINRYGPSPRQEKMQGVGGSKPAIDALFDELAAGNLAKKIYEGDGGSYVVLQVVNRALPKAEDFDKTADAEIARMQQARAKAAVHDWLKGRCETLTKAGKIRPAPDRIREVDDKGNPTATVYHPCMYLEYLDR